MKRIITIVCLLVSSLSYGQIRYNQMPDLDSLAGGDYVPVFRPPYDQGKATFSTLIDLIGAGTGVDSIWRVTGKDSIFYLKGGITYKIKDSTGSGGGGATWGTITGALEDQKDLYDSLFNRVRYADTAAMLSYYLRKIDTLSLSTRINSKITDSSFVDWASSVTITGLTSLTTKQMQYCTIGKIMFINIDFRCASPNSSGTTTTFTIPRNAASWSGEQRGIIHGVNSTTQGACLWKIASGSNLVEVAIGANDTAFSSWTNGTARRIEGFIMININ